MASTDQILEKARELGKLVAGHDAVRKLSEAVRRLEQDADAQRAIHDLERHYQSLSEKQAAGRPIEVADKRELERLQLTVARHPLLRDLQVLQMDYLDLMRRVDETIREQAEPAEPEAVSAPINPDLSSLR